MSEQRRKVKVTSAKRMPLDTTDAESSLWLVKIPEYIARRWANKDPNEMLGRMNVTLVPDKIGNGPPAKKIKVSLFNEEGDSSSSSSSSSATSNPPTKVVNDFIIEEKNVCKVKECVEKGIAGKSCPHMTIRQMYAFDHDKKTGAFSVSGRVTKNCVLEPESLEDYGLMMKAMARDAEINRSKRSTKTLVAESNLLTGTNGEMVFIPPVHANKEKVEKDRSENDIKKDLLTALGDNERMTMKELCGFCKCKDSDLKPLLDKFCYYHKKGQYVKFYELKQEFKNYAR